MPFFIIVTHILVVSLIFVALILSLRAARQERYTEGIFHLLWSYGFALWVERMLTFPWPK